MRSLSGWRERIAIAHRRMLRVIYSASSQRGGIPLSHLQPQTNEGHRRAVVRVLHDVDKNGHVVKVELEPLPDAAGVDAVHAAWQAARRCHPWVVGDAAAAELDQRKAIAISQVDELVQAAREVLFVAAGDAAGGDSPLPPRIKDLQAPGAFERLRNAIVDLRPYMPALRGTPAVPEISTPGRNPADV